ncbi:ScbA/BarX family gamma-butyrolactone biosynthesis protein [Streptomyces cinnamoneus]|uniref:ScbA/BarX family gamma-butyrolactone biosynthesis protein n=1 Tax=Streptomyces cinnamoneus TaxID=53446 RepID=UPI00167DD57D|nr:ScbA/BarX family gamma-butyrolactone biosynthesis protein [Streptomyces cinnamoneus]
MPATTASSPSSTWAGSPLPGLGRGLSHTHRVPRHTVHKAAATEVLLTDARRLAEDRFAVAALWPRDRFLTHRGSGGHADPMLLVETVRQTTIFLSHRFYGVPADRPFVLCDLGFDLDEPLPSGDGSPLPLTLDVSLAPTATGPGRFGMRLQATVHHGERRLGTACQSWQAVTPERYDRIRYRHPVSPAAPGAWEHATPLHPAAVGYQRTSDVLLATVPGTAATAGHRTWQLRMDQNHPVLFDHASDHIPGMVLMEAFRQAAHVLAAHDAGAGAHRPVSLASASTAFHSFGELDAPVTISAQPVFRAGPYLNVTAAQQDRTLASALVRPALPGTEGSTAC